MKKRSHGSTSSRRRPAPRDVVRTFYVVGLLVAALVLYVLVVGPFLLVAGVTFDRTRRIARRTAQAVYAPLLRHFCRLAGFPLKVELPVDFPSWSEIGPCIVVANHASSTDVLMLMQLPPGIGDGRIWAKPWPFRKPLLGWLMRLSGHLRVDNFNLLPDARDFLEGGETMLVFPESSRSRTGKVSRFRDGAFLLAVRTGHPVIPVAVHGTFASFPPEQPWIFRPNLRVQVLGILYPDGNDPRSHLVLKQRAHDMIEAAMSEPSELVHSGGVAMMSGKP